MQFDNLLSTILPYLSSPLSSALFINVMKEATKKIEMLCRKTKFNLLGALRFDEDVRYLNNFCKARLAANNNPNNDDDDDDMNSHQSVSDLLKKCEGLDRLSQISRILNVVEVEDLENLRGKGWKIKPQEIKGYLRLRTDLNFSWDMSVF